MPTFVTPTPDSFLLPLPRHQEPKTQPTAPTAPGTADTATGTGTVDPGGAPPPKAPNAPIEQCGNSTFLMMGLFLALMYFMVLRPESKRRKETAQMLAATKAGDVVVTIGGMHGVVDSLADKTMVLRIGDQRMTFDRSAIARVVRDDAAPAAGRKA